MTALPRTGAIDGARRAKERMTSAMPPACDEEPPKHSDSSRMSTLVVAVPRTARRNLDLGLDKGVWGFPQGPPTMRQARTQDYAQLSRDDYV